jgi:hypothetical protein
MSYNTAFSDTHANPPIPFLERQVRYLSPGVRVLETKFHMDC